MIVSRERVRLHSSKDAGTALRKALGKMDRIDQDKENFWVIHLNGRNTMICVELISVGCATSSIVHPREVFRRAMANGAVAIIVGHNHPSGDPSPSTDDRRLTERLVNAGQILGIKVLDHVIIASEGFVSLMDHNI